MKSVNEVWIKTVFYVFNTVFVGEYDGKLNKNKKNSPAWIWTHNFGKKSHFLKSVTKKSDIKRVIKKEWYHMNRALVYFFIILDGAATTLLSCDPLPEVKEAFENLISRNPKTFWTSGKYIPSNLSK